jgi:hypothetical protein
MQPSDKRAMARLLVAAIALVPCLILLLPIFAITGVLWTFASAVRALSKLFEPEFIRWTELSVFDRKLGWKPKPDLDVHYLVELDDVYRVVTDEEGWPGKRSLDSCPRLPVKAVGAPGYSMVHGVLLMELLARRLSGKLVVWFVYMENDLQDNLVPEMRQYRAPFVRPAPPHGWQIVDEHIVPQPWRCSNLDTKRLFPHFCVPGPLADRAFSAADYLIGRALEACNRADAHLVLFTIPHPMQLSRDGVATLAMRSGNGTACDEDYPDRRIADSCQRHGVPVIIGKDHLSAREYKRREGIHWNERGHRRMAVLLKLVHDHFDSGTLDDFIAQHARTRANKVSSDSRWAQLTAV